MSSPVLFTELNTHNGYRIGVATLNQPKVLNGLSLEMCRLLSERLAQWEADPDVVLVIMQGAGDKAFCAGGDLHGLYQSMQIHQGQDAWANTYSREFFEVEYKLDYQIHTSVKPIICWGHGIVMGGGIGLMIGASHRVVSESSRLAMPEVSIGLFPDVGGSWVLNHLPGKTGAFLASTGAILNTSDALFSGLANYQVDHASWTSVVNALQASDWQAPQHRTFNDDIVHAVLSAHKGKPAEAGPLQQHYGLINEICAPADIKAIYRNIALLKDSEDAWLSRAAATMLKGAPLSMALGIVLQRKALHLSLADVFRMEYIVALHCCADGQLQEGIRALLVDKDKNPQWTPSGIDDVSEALLASYLAAPWPASDKHPLSDLA
ncbi:enoyl-CoA hydratase/isomerase family protein [Advenella sp. RU8]|uniref:enoyl-CoA hydratase/isomerase family protein n=1 Tax=Advenella sp. RU8 TaxID=3399575 RepID=UPI003AAC9527